MLRTTLSGGVNGGPETLVTIGAQLDRIVIG